MAAAAERWEKQAAHAGVRAALQCVLMVRAPAPSSGCVLVIAHYEG